MVSGPSCSQRPSPLPVINVASDKWITRVALGSSRSGGTVIVPQLCPAHPNGARAPMTGSRSREGSATDDSGTEESPAGRAGWEAADWINANARAGVARIPSAVALRILASSSLP